MLFLFKLIQWLYVTNIGISISGFVLVLGITHFFELKNALIYAIIVFLLTFSVYHLQRIADQEDFYIKQFFSFQSKNMLLIYTCHFCIINASILGLFVFNFNWQLLSLTLLFILFCTAYTIPILSKKLREIQGIKIIIISLTWCFACVFFPLANEGVSLKDNVCFSLIIFCYFVAITIPFDIRDVNKDDDFQKTFPQVFGIFIAKLIGSLLLFLVYWLSKIFGFLPQNELFFYFAIIIQAVLIIFSNTNKPNIYYSTIDLLIILLGISYL